MYPALSFLFGLLFGSFGNSLVHRLPRKLIEEYEQEAYEALGQTPPSRDPALRSSRSRCPHCKHQIAWYDNLPLVSWLLLKAKCRHCGASIATRYFLLEASGGVLGLLAYVSYGPTLTALVAFAAALLLLWLTAIDIEHLLLPDSLVFALMWLGLIASTQGLFISPEKAIIGTVFGYGMPFVAAQAYSVLRKTEGMGMGDFKLLAALGSFAGPMGVVLVLMGSALLQVLVQGSLIASARLQKDSPFPFGPALSLVGGLAVFGAPYFQRCLGIIGQ